MVLAYNRGTLHSPPWHESRPSHAIAPTVRKTAQDVETPAKFDASTKLANTDFVQRARGGMVGYARVDADRALTADDTGFVLLLGFAAATLTIPTPQALNVPYAAGACVHLHCTGPYDAQLVAGVGTSLTAPDATASITLKKGQSLTLMATTNQIWRVIDSTAELWRNADFSSKLATSSGHQKLPGNFIMQFGDATATPAGNSIAFDIAFPVECFGVCLTGANSDAVNRLGAGKPSRTGFAAYSSDSTPATRYIAFGK